MSWWVSMVAWFSDCSLLQFQFIFWWGAYLSWKKKTLFLQQWLRETFQKFSMSPTRSPTCMPKEFVAESVTWRLFMTTSGYWAHYKWIDLPANWLLLKPLWVSRMHVVAKMGKRESKNTKHHEGVDCYIINPLLTKPSRSRRLDIGLILFLCFYGAWLQLGP